MNPRSKNVNHSMSRHVCAAIFAALAFSGTLKAIDWRYFRPILSSQTQSLENGEANELLASFCRTPIHSVKGVGPTCPTGKLGKAFDDITDQTFHPKGVIFGHFIGPDSDDAAVSGWSAETHPYLWGGTLLLSKRGNAWVPVWYRSAIIIESCERIALPDRREILLCEDEDSGMGHALHYLYTVDFEHPADVRHTLLATAKSFKEDCVEQTQILKGIRWGEDRREFSVEVDTAKWKRLSNEPYCANSPNSRPAPLHLNFLVTSEGVRKMQPRAEVPCRKSKTKLPRLLRAMDRELRGPALKRRPTRQIKVRFALKGVIAQVTVKLCPLGKKSSVENVDLHKVIANREQARCTKPI
jgi:hypothetical protein